MPTFIAVIVAALYAVVIVLLLGLAWRFVAAVERIADSLERRP